MTSAIYDFKAINEALRGISSNALGPRRPTYVPDPMDGGDIKEFGPPSPLTNEKVLDELIRRKLDESNAGKGKRPVNRAP